MDVSLARIAAILTFSLIISACSSDRDAAETKFRNDSNDNKAGTNPCDSTSVIENEYIVVWKNGKIKSLKGVTKEQVIDEVILPNLDEIHFAEPNRRIFLNRKPLNPATIIRVADYDNWGAEFVDAGYAWSNDYRGQGVKVAVIDSGFDLNHSQLQNQVAVNDGEIAGNGIDDDQNGLIDDYYGYNFLDDNSDLYDDVGHGTHVAGTIAAAHNDSSVKEDKVQGIAPEAKILPIKFIDYRGGSTDAAINSIDYAVERGAHIINASWGGAACVDALNNKVAALASQGVLFVAASGNDSMDIDTYPVFPAAIQSVGLITVGAINEFGDMTHFSNYGFQNVHLFAPGDNIDSTTPGFLDGHSNHEYKDGTSMAAPFVTAAAAVLLSKRPDASIKDLRNALLNSVTVDAHHKNATQGHLNLKAALKSLK